MTVAERDRGSAGVEAALAVTTLLLVAWFTVGALRVTTTSGDVGAAARAGARAAAAARIGFEQAAGESVAAQALADRGVACVGGADVSVTPGATQVGAADPVRTMTVTVACTVGLDDVTPAGFQAARAVSATATEMVDPLRGGTRD
jgi:hypothetical protein